ncbi:MAG: VOC family protein [Bacteroidetes bacterium]|nr:VOC family protein [Bacteroidota bacterium]
MAKVMCGIQQIGIGVTNVYEAWKWYRKHFGMDIRIFDEAAEAGLMLPYTGGEPRRRHAVLAMNLQGGGGFEIWQYTDRIPESPKFGLQLGDLGIFAAKIKCRDVHKTYYAFLKQGLNLHSEPAADPSGEETFFLKDPYNNIFQMVKDDYLFREENKLTGSVFGAIIGVSDIDKSRKIYSDILGYDTVIYDKEGAFGDLTALPGGSGKFRRVLLKHSKPVTGSFSKLFGPSRMELVQAIDRPARKIYEDRLWGDLGFIHLCFDVRGMDDLRRECEEAGFAFTVDSSKSFDMGEAAGHFSYIADLDGTLIEFVETHKVPVIKKLGVYINLRKRPPEKSLPAWMVKAMRFNRYKGE